MPNLNPGNAISPVDGRYHDKTEELSAIFSEKGLMKARIIVEIEYLISLISFLGKDEVEPLSEEDENVLRDLYSDFSDSDFEEIKAFEKTTRHDVKSVEYFLRKKLSSIGLEKYSNYVHLGRTSEDINNLAYALVLKYGTAVVLEYYENTFGLMDSIAMEHKDTPMIALTHGQPATASTIGWTMAVYSKRLQLIIENRLRMFCLSVKFNGATGGNNAMYVAYPDLNWEEFSEILIANLEFIKFENGINPDMLLEVNHVTFQIEPHDTYKELFEILTSLNTVLIDFCQNMWMYISQEYFIQKPVVGEVGSSAMPQKINPIDFENAEGNLILSNAMFEVFSRKLPLSRFYRDLSDSTIERNFGVAYSYSLIALKSLKRGLGRICVNEAGLEQKLDEHWEIISEAYQVILRASGFENGYELLAKAVKGKEVTKELLHSLVDTLASSLNLNIDVVEKLKAVTPHNYLGNRNFLQM